MRPIGTAEELQRRRLRAVELVEQGESPDVVAHFLGCGADDPPSTPGSSSPADGPSHARPPGQDAHHQGLGSPHRSDLGHQRRDGQPEAAAGPGRPPAPGRHQTNAHGEDTVEFLRDLKRHLAGPLTVMWDRANIHDRSRVVWAYLARHPGIITEKFPGYAPETNPDEMVWEHTKAWPVGKLHGRGHGGVAGRPERGVRPDPPARPSCCRRSSGMPGSGSDYDVSLVGCDGISSVGGT